jgi:hypothetical protein
MKPQAKIRATAIGAAIGYAADRHGNGVAYARLDAGSSRHLLRVPFRAARTLLPEREVGYFALTAVIRALLKRGVRSVDLRLDDPALVDDLTNRRALPDALVLAHVRLRCALNQLDAFRLELVPESDLAQRARAEVALNVAA